MKQFIGVVWVLSAWAAAGPPQEQFQAAQQLLMRGDLAGAQQAATEGLRAVPRSIEGLNLLGIIYDRQGQFERAEASYNQALKVDTNSAGTYNNLGNHYLLTHKTELAERQFRRTLQLRPNDATANLNLGSLLLSRGEARAGVMYLERVHPVDAETVLALVGGYLDLGETQRGLALSQKVSSEAGDNAQIHFSLGVVLGAKRQYEAAVRELEIANARMPGTFEIAYNLGQAYLREGNYDKASESLRKAVDEQPRSVATLCLLAEAESARHAYGAALQALGRAHELEPENTDVYFLIAQISGTHGLYDEAAAVLQQAIQIAPQKPELQAALAQSYFDAGKTDEAIGEFKRLVEKDPSAASYGLLGRALQRTGHFDEAKQYLEKGLAKDARNAVCLYVLGAMADKQGDGVRAEKYLDAAVKSAPDFGDALYALGEVKIRQEKFQEGAALLRRCIAVSPDSVKAYYRLASAERHLGQQALAAADVKKFAELSRRKKQEQRDVRQLLANAAHEQKSSDPRFVALSVDTYLKNGQVEKAREAAARLGDSSAEEERAQIAVGTLFAKYRYYEQAVKQFERVLNDHPDSADTKYDLALASVQGRQYARALEMLQAMPERERKNDYEAVLGDVYLHTGRLPDAVQQLKAAVGKNPENEQYMALLALAQLVAGQAAEADETLRAGLVRLPQSGLLYWVRGVARGSAQQQKGAQEDLIRAVDLLPEWQGGYAALNVLYLKTGQTAQARQLQGRMKSLFGDMATAGPGSMDLLQAGLEWVDHS